MAEIKAHQLTEGQTVVIRGTLEYSRLMSLISGDELQRSIAQQRQMGVTYPTTKEHTRIVLRDAQVLYADPNNPTAEEQYAAQKLYQSKKNPEKGMMYSMDNKSPFLPPIWVPANPANLAEGYEQLTDPEGELDNGLNVSVVLETFKSGNNANLGLGLTSVVVNEAPRYYINNRVDRDKLAAMGIVFKSNPVNPTYNLAPQAGGDQPQQDNTDNQGMPTPGIGQQPQQNQAQPQQQYNQQPTPQQGQQQYAPQPQAPQQNQVQSQPAQPQQNQYAFPQQGQQNQPQQPAQQQYAPQPQQNPNSAFGQQQPQPQQNQQVDPWTGEPVQGGQNGGIIYN